MMWWNYVARTAEEVQSAHDDWEAGSKRFGPVASTLPRVASAPPIGLHRGPPAQR